MSNLFEQDQPKAVLPPPPPPGQDPASIRKVEQVQADERRRSRSRSATVMQQEMSLGGPNTSELMGM